MFQPIEIVPEPSLTTLLYLTYSSPAVNVLPMLKESVVRWVIAPIVKSDPSPVPFAAYKTRSQVVEIPRPERMIVA